MKTKRSYVLAAVHPARDPFFQKMLMAFLILALMLASLPLTSVFAAPGSNQDSTDITDTLELEWKNKLRNLRLYGLFYERVRLNPTDFEDPDDLVRAHYFLEKYGFALKQANTVVFNHTGFDIKGNVTNEIRAEKSVKDLAMYLSMMRGFREKFDEVVP
jgi:hypothetical protein